METGDTEMCAVVTMQYVPFAGNIVSFEVRPFADSVFTHGFQFFARKYMYDLQFSSKMHCCGNYDRVMQLEGSYSRWLRQSAVFAWVSQLHTIVNIEKYVMATVFISLFLFIDGSSFKIRVVILIRSHQSTCKIMYRSYLKHLSA